MNVLTVEESGTYEVGVDDTVGSIAGSGAITLGDKRLTVGGDNSMEFSGVASGVGGIAESEQASRH